MPVPKKKSSSSSTKQHHATDKKFRKDSAGLDDSILEGSVQEESVMTVDLEETKPRTAYQDELVLIFFKSMLDVIVDEWAAIPDVDPSTCTCKRETPEPTVSKDFKELSAEDLQNMDVADVAGSKVSLQKRRRSKRRDSSNSKSTKEKRNSEKKEKKSVTSERSKKSNVPKQSKMSLKRSRSPTKTETKKSFSSSYTDTMVFLHSDISLDKTPYENVIIRFKNGNCYEGPVRKKLMHGFGKFTWADGTVYEGNFVHGDATGTGMLQYPDLTAYQGNFCRNILHGEGVLNISDTPMIYSGNWKAGKKHGQGWLLYEAGNWYEGEWYEDSRQGMGFRNYKTGEKYKGRWYQGKRQGQGTLVWPNNDIYRGHWFDNHMHGYGEYTWNGFLNLTLTFPLENTYRGSWLKGIRSGVGIMDFGTAGGAKLTGVWSNDQKHGPGIFVGSNGAVVKSNPLFWCDKPIQLGIASQQGYSSLPPCQSDVSEYLRHSEDDASSCIPCTNKSALQLLTQQIYAAGDHRQMDSQILDFVLQSQEEIRESIEIQAFNASSECAPLHIPVHSPPEQTDFSHYISLAVNKYTAKLYGCDNVNCSEGTKVTKGLPSTISKYSKWNLLTCNSADISKFLKTSYNYPDNGTEEMVDVLALQQTQTAVEEKHLRNCIIANLSELHKLYNKYATIASPHTLNFKPTLIRLFLWQMLRDINILGGQYSLVDIDLILMKNPEIKLETEHCPFEKILFWQFLQIVMALSWLTHDPNDVTEECKRFGILNAIFTKFLTNILFEKPTAVFACSLFEYRDLLPIKSVYSFYRSIGEPHTARTFLRNICTKKREQPPCYLKIFRDEQIHLPRRGINAVPVGGNITFLPDDPPGIGEKPRDPDPEPSCEDPFRKELFALRSIGAKKAVRCLVDVCPQIAADGLVINMEYQLTFLEFYDTLLLCAFMVVDAVKRKEERIRLREERRRLKEIETEEKSASSATTKTEKHAKEKIRLKS